MNNSTSFVLYLLVLTKLLSVPNSATAQTDIQGHRGCRGLMPENTVEGFIHALRLGVTTLEMDVVITSDKQVLLSHEPFMSHEICLDPEGNEISESQEKSHNIYLMTIDQVRRYDCGSKFHPRFPDQQKLRVSKPTLNDVIDSVEAYIRSAGISPVDYNIEIKSTPSNDNKYHPETAEFAELLYRLLLEKGVTSRTIIQSFDPRPLRYLREKQPKVRLSLLVENVKSPEWNIRRLGFIPDIYSPYFKLIGKRRVSKLQSQGIKVIPWTVNETSEMQRMLEFGVDGIITDYPDRLVKLLSR